MKISRILFIVLVFATCIAFAADKNELRARFERRYPAVLQYKSQGKIGETLQGLLGAVEAKYLEDAKLAKLMSDENSDRDALYEIIAKEENTTPQKVAERMARRNYEKAKPGEYLQAADGTWKKK